MRALAYLVSLAVLLTVAAPVRADNRQLAKEAYRDGSRLYDLADYKSALDAFRKAYFNFEEPSFLFNIAQCHRQLGNTADALKFYRTYLRKQNNPPNAEEVKKLIAQLETTLETEKAMRAAPPGGTTSPGGTELAHSPPPEPKAVPVEPAPVALVVAQPAPAKTPVYKKWWLWTIVGVVAVGAAVGIGLGLDSARPLQPTAPAVRF